MLDYMRECVIQIKNNEQYIFYETKNDIINFSALLGLLAFFVSFSDVISYISDSADFLSKLSIGFTTVAIISFLFFIRQVIFVLSNKRVKVIGLNAGHNVYVQYGDIFSSGEVLNPVDKRIVVIAVNRCFDTMVDNDLVSENTLHGIAMKRLYDNQTYTQDSLNEVIKKQLELQNKLITESVCKNAKRKGNLTVGTVAEIDNPNDNILYFFLALSTFDENLKASTSDEDYVIALLRLLQYIDARSQGMPVVLPLIGGGLSKTNINEGDILNEMIQLMKIKKYFLHGDIHIVIRNCMKNSIPIYNFAMKGE